MRVSIFMAVAVASLLAAGCKDKGTGNQVAAPFAPVAAVAAPNGGDWTQTVSITPEGGYRMGNPDAPVKLVEYASYTCPHCAEFSKEATQKLESDYVKSGRISWEFRPFQLFPTDLGISLLVRCQGADASFLLAEQLYATQRDWVGKLQSLSEDEQKTFNAMPPQQRVGALVRAAGLDQFFRQRGMPEGRMQSCLADEQGIETILGITDRGSKQFNVTGTPTFFINGQKVEDVAGWQLLEPQLKRAVGA
ncbi:MAG: thioredoxin domain-containing protein [Sphingomonadales bacterium]